MKLYGSFEGFKYYIQSKPHMGAYVAMENFAYGLLEHGSFDEYHAYYDEGFLDSLSKDQVIKAYFGNDKLKVKRISSLIRHPHLAYHVIHFEEIHPYEEVTLRNILSEKKIPVTRRVYTISTVAHLREFLNLCVLNNGGRLYDSIVVPSRCTRDVLLDYFADVASATAGKFVYKGRVDVIPYGIDIREFQPDSRLDSRNALSLPLDATILLCLARISKVSKMNYERLLTVFSRLVEKADKDLLLLIAGADLNNEAHGVTEIAEKLKIANKITLITNFKDETKKKILGAADIFISLSDNLQESFGISLIEAMATGLPVICTDWNGYKDIVDDGVTGYRIPVGWKVREYPEDLLAGLRNPYDHRALYRMSQDLEIDTDMLVARALSLIHDEDLRRKMGQCGKDQCIKAYSIKGVVSRFEELWQELNEIAEKDNTPYTDLGSILRYDYARHFRGYPSHFIEM